MNRLPVAIAQLNFTVGDVDANVDRMLDAADKARSELGWCLLYPSDAAGE